jgi:hypothetical protein
MKERVIKDNTYDKFEDTKDIAKTRNLISNGRHYIASPYLHGETYLSNGLSFQRASTVKTQVSVLTTYIISKYYQFIYIINIVFSSLFKCFCCTYITY